MLVAYPTGHHDTLALTGTATNPDPKLPPVTALGLCDVVTVQRALGHAKATTTLNTHAHLWPSAEDRTRAASGALAGEVLGILADNLRTTGAL